MNSPDTGLLEVIIESWDRNNRILVNLLSAIPEGGLEARVMPGSPSVAEMFTHIHYVRLIFLAEDASAFALPVPTKEWRKDASADAIAAELEKSSQAVGQAVESLIRSNQEMALHYDHPLFFLLHMIWHEGYHHGQIKLALKQIGRPLEDREIGPLTWGIWMDKSK